MKAAKEGGMGGSRSAPAKTAAPKKAAAKKAVKKR